MLARLVYKSEAELEESYILAYGVMFFSLRPAHSQFMAGACVTKCQRSEHHINDSAQIVEYSCLLTLPMSPTLQSSKLSTQEYIITSPKSVISDMDILGSSCGTALCISRPGPRAYLEPVVRIILLTGLMASCSPA